MQKRINGSCLNRNLHGCIRKEDVTAQGGTLTTRLGSLYDARLFLNWGHEVNRSKPNRAGTVNNATDRILEGFDSGLVVVTLGGS